MTITSCLSLIPSLVTLFLAIALPLPWPVALSLALAFGVLASALGLAREVPRR